MLDFEKSDNEKLNIIQEETFAAYNIINIVADVLIYRYENDEKDNYYDCISLLQEAKNILNKLPVYINLFP